ncbi:hypothetical protein ACFYUV_03975 [Nonomuraea sp. NPDC003560]|uniref:hypothetical protein n=1 Tax=Nonomuraea sp. NPDC003560 TaxID=3364341 RepID=UPI0036D0AF4E
MTSRRMARALRAEAELLDACGDQQEALQAAKAAFEEDPTEETLAARREAMAEMRRFRAWLRAAARVRDLREVLRTGLDSKGQPISTEVRAAAEQEIERLVAEHGEPLAGQQGPPPDPGDAAVHVQPVRGRGRTMRPGGA